MKSFNAEELFNIGISFNQNIEGLILTLIDGTLNPVLEEKYFKELSLQLAPGLYQLKVYYIDYYQEYIIQADADKEITLDFNYPSVAPVLSFKTTTPVLSDIAELASRASTADKDNGRPSFLFFAAKYDATAFPEITTDTLLKEYRLLDTAGLHIYTFEPDNTHIDPESGCIAFSTNLNTGLYFIEWQSGEDKRILPFYIIDDYQTQFFIRYTNKPDFENSLFFYGYKTEFSRDNEAYVTLDKILYAYKDYRNYELLSGNDLNVIRENPYLVALIKILQAFLKKESDFEDTFYLELPDFEFITHSSKRKTIKKRDDILPTLSFVMSNLGVFRKKDGLQFKPGSLIDRTTDHSRFDIFWNSFTQIDEVSEWKDIYTNLIQKFNKVNIKDDVIKHEANSPEQLKNASAENEPSSLKDQISDVFFNITDVSKIASKLNVPPTKILRNFTAYKDIFDKLE